MTKLGADRVWDQWVEATADRPELTPEEFADSFGSEAERALELLSTLLAVRRGAPPPPLVDLLTPDSASEDGRPRFAGFRLDRGLGQGASGVVFLATDLRPGRGEQRVALKVLNPLVGAAAERRELILREAEIAARLDHEGIVRVLDQGVDRGYAWIAAEWVEGETLEREIDSELPWASPERLERAIDVGLQLSRALAHAHGLGVIHRDLKPANLLIDTSGRLRILDFGLARAEGTAFALSSTGEAIGTPLYMAPEQARGDPRQGPATDIYAVGLILLELALGPPDGPDLDAARTLARIARGRLGSLRRRLRALPRGLRQVVSRCLEVHPDDRYRDAGELEADLEDLRAGRAPRVGTLSPVSRRLRSLRRHPVRSVAALAAFLLLGWTSWYVWWNWPQDVHIETHRDGKVIWIDGVERGMTPLDVRLRPGEHTYKCQFLPEEEGLPTHSGTFQVPHRSPSYPFFVFDTQLIIPGIETGIAPEQPSAFVQISTPHLRIDVGIDGQIHADQPGIVSTRLPLGRHEVRIEAPGKRSIEEEVELTDQQLCMLSYELDDIDSEWHTIILYSPFDYLVRRGLIDVDRARVLCESSQAGSQDLTFVYKVYWGPTANYEEASVLVFVDLPVAPSDLEFLFEQQDLVQRSGPCWNLTEMGPAPDSLIPMCATKPGGAPAHLATDALDAQPTPERIAALVALLDGRQRLFIRFRVGGVPVGGNVAYACALRSNALPFRSQGGELHWSPALRIRVRAR